MKLYINKKKLFITLSIYGLFELIILTLSIYLLFKSNYILNMTLRIIFILIIVIANLSFILYSLLEFLFYNKFDITFFEDHIKASSNIIKYNVVIYYGEIRSIKNYKTKISNRIFITYNNKLIVLKYFSNEDVNKIMGALNDN